MDQSKYYDPDDIKNLTRIKLYQFIKKTLHEVLYKKVKVKCNSLKEINHIYN